MTDALNLQGGSTMANVENDDQQTVVVRLDITIPAKSLDEVSAITKGIVAEARKHGKVEGHVSFGRTKLPLG